MRHVSNPNDPLYVQYKGQKYKIALGDKKRQLQSWLFNQSSKKAYYIQLIHDYLKQGKVKKSEHPSHNVFQQGIQEFLTDMGINMSSTEVISHYCDSQNPSPTNPRDSNQR